MDFVSCNSKEKVIKVDTRVNNNLYPNAITKAACTAPRVEKRSTSKALFAHDIGFYMVVWKRYAPGAQLSREPWAFKKKKG